VERVIRAGGWVRFLVLVDILVSSLFAYGTERGVFFIAAVVGLVCCDCEGFLWRIEVPFLSLRCFLPLGGLAGITFEGGCYRVN